MLTIASNPSAPQASRARFDPAQQESHAKRKAANAIRMLCVSRNLNTTGDSGVARNQGKGGIRPVLRAQEISSMVARLPASNSTATLRLRGKAKAKPNTGISAKSMYFDKYSFASPGAASP